ncbi:MAG: autotransporter-associated beta strand repeat-containing protein, partial [Tepidisphaeraceae bacterium]
TRIEGGIVKLDFSAATSPATNIIGNITAPLVLAGGGLNLTGKASATNTQTFNGLTLNPGGSAIVMAPNATANPLLLTLGTITRNPGSTIDFTISGTQSAANGIVVGNSNDANGLLFSGFATVNGTDWATVSGGNIIATTNYTSVASPGTIAAGAATNVKITGSAAGTVSLAAAGTTNINTLVQSDTAATSLSIGAGNTLRLTGGGILLTGAGTLTIPVGGTLTAGAADNTAGELAFIQNTNTNAVIAPLIADNGTGAVSVIYSASAPVATQRQFTVGATIASGGVANTYTGGTTISNVRVNPQNAGAFSTGAVNITSGGQIWLTTTDTFSNNITIAGDGWAESGGPYGVIRFANATTGSTISGNITLAADSRLGALESGAIGTISGAISGGYGIEKSGAGTITLSGNNTYTGPTMITAGTLKIGAGGTSGTLGAGPVINYGTLYYNRSDDTTVSNLITGTGTVDKIGAGKLILSSAGNTMTSVSAAGGILELSGISSLTTANLNVADSGVTGGAGGTLNVKDTAALTVSTNFLMGNQASNAGTVNQTGGTVTYTGVNTNLFRVGHWPTETSTYNLSSGTLSTLWSPIYIGWDGTGVVNQSGGALNAMQLSVTTNGHTGGAGTYTLTGGTLNLGSGGIIKGSTGTANVNLGGGTIAAAATAVPISAATTLTGTNGNVTFDSAGSANNITVSGVMSGAGGFTKINNGTLTLSAANSFTGNVIVNGGTLLATAQGAANANGPLGAYSGTRTITVNSGATMSWTINNVIGGGGMTAAGMETIILNGGTLTSTRYNAIGNITLSNGAILTQNATDGPGSYEGYQFIGTISVTGTSPSTISAGTTARNNHLFNGTTTFDVADVTGDANVDLTVSSGLKNSSGDYGNGSPASVLNKIGAGTMLLTGNNTYSGGTTVNAGTLRVGNGGTTGTPGTGAVTVNSAGTLVLNRSDNLLNVTQAFSGAGSFVQAGPGILELAGSANAVTGPIAVTGGTLRIGSGGTSGTIGTGDISVSSGATLALNRSDVFTTSNNLAGAGTLLQSGSGTAILTGNNNMTGPVVISAGTLQAGNGGTAGGLGSGNVSVASNTTLAIDRSDTITLSNVISGAGTLNQIGTGTTVLAGANTMTGPVNVNAGTLRVYGGGTLGGADTNGYYGNVTIANSASLVFQPSGSIIVSNNINTGYPSVNPSVVVSSGDVTLNGNGYFQGAVSISSGATLCLGSSANNSLLTAAKSISIASGAILDFSTVSSAYPSVPISGFGTVIGGTNGTGSSFALIPGTDGTAGTLTVSPPAGNSLTLSGGKLMFDLSNSAGSGNDLLVVNGDINVSGTTTVAIHLLNGALDASRNYVLATYTGTLLNPATSLSNLQLDQAFAQSRSTYAIVNDATARQLELQSTFVAPSNLLWTGAMTGNWSVKTAADTNWQNLSGDPAHGISVNAPDMFYQNDNVSFVNPTATTVNVVQGSGQSAVSVGNLQFNRDNTQGLTINGYIPINALGNISKTGNGAVTLAVPGVTAVGSLAVSGGTLDLSYSYNDAIGGDITVSGGATLTASSSVNSGGNLTVTGTGSTMNYGGGTVGGNLALDNGAGLTATSAMTVSGNVSVIGGSGGSSTLTANSDLNAATGSLTVGGGSIVTLSTATFGKEVSVSGASTLNINSTLAAPSLTVSGGSIFGGYGNTTLTGALALNDGSITAGTISAASFAVSKGSLNAALNNATGVMAGLTKSGADTVTITSQNNGYTGPTTINGGVLAVQYLADGGNSSSIGASDSSAANLVINGGTLSFAPPYPNTSTTNRNVTVGASGAGIDATSGATLQLNGALAGAGTVTFAGSGGTIVLNNANTYAGGSIINTGTVKVLNSGAFGTAASNSVTINNGGTLDVNGMTLSKVAVTVSGAGVDGTSGAIINTGAQAVGGPWLALTMAGDTTFGGTGRWDVRNDTTTGTGVAFNMNGNTLTKTGANYVSIIDCGTVLNPGNIVINQGTLDLGRGIILPNTPGKTITVNSGGTLWMGEYGNTTTAIGMDLVINDGATWGSGANPLSANGITGSITLNGASTLSTAGGTLRITGPITGTGSLTKIGANTVTLLGTNTYTGLTTISAGIVQVGNGGTTGTLAGPVYIDSSGPGSLVINRSDAITLPGALSGSGNLTKPGTSILTLSGDNSSFNGNILFSAGTVALDYTTNNNAKINPSGMLVLGGGTLQVIGSPAGGYAQTTGGLTLNSVTSSSVVNASGLTELQLGSITRNAGATVNFTTGGGGILVYGTTAGNMIGPWATVGNEFATVDANNLVTTLVATPNATINTTVPTDNVEVTSTLNPVHIAPSNSINSLNVQGSGLTVNLATYDLAVTSGGLLNSGGSNSIIGTGVLSTTSTEMVVNANSDLSIATPIGATGANFALTKAGPGTLTLSNSASAYAGATTVTGGTLVIPALANGGVASAIGASGNAATNLVLGGTLRIMGTSTSDRGFTVAGAGAAISVDSGATVTLSGSGVNGDTTGLFVKAGAGTLVFNAASTYTGGTEVAGGTLQLNVGNSAAGAILGTVTVDAGATLLMTQKDTFGYNGAGVNTLNINGGTVMQNVNNNNTLGGTSVFAINMTGGTLTSASGGYYDFLGNVSVNTMASVATSTISSRINLRNTTAQLTTTFTVADGPAAVDLLVSGAITEEAAGRAIVKAGPGLMALSGSNTYTGATTVSAGTLRIGGAGLLGGGTYAGAVTIATGATLDYASSATQTLSSAISGPGVLKVSGP